MVVSDITNSTTYNIATSSSFNGQCRCICVPPISVAPRAIRQKKTRHSKISSLCASSPIGIEIIFHTAPILVHIVTPPNCDRDRLLLNSFGMENSPQDLPHPPTSLSSHSSISATSLLTESSPGTTINSAAITHPNATINDESDFSKVRISDDEWNVRLQDPGCTKDALASNTYRR